MEEVTGMDDDSTGAGWFRRAEEREVASGWDHNGSSRLNSRSRGDSGRSCGWVQPSVQVKTEVTVTVLVWVTG